MILSQITVGFDKLSEVLGLPPDTKVVAVKENEFGNHLFIKIVGPREPVNVNLAPHDPISRLGEAYAEGAVAQEPVSRTKHDALAMGNAEVTKG